MATEEGGCLNNASPEQMNLLCSKVIVPCMERGTGTSITTEGGRTGRLMEAGRGFTGASISRRPK